MKGEQCAKQQANTIKQKAAMTQVKIVMKGVMKGEQCAMLHQWSARAMDAKQAERDERDAAELEALMTVTEERTAELVDQLEAEVDNYKRELTSVNARAEAERAQAAIEKEKLMGELAAMTAGAKAKAV